MDLKNLTLVRDIVLSQIQEILKSGIFFAFLKNKKHIYGECFLKLMTN